MRIYHFCPFAMAARILAAANLFLNIGGMENTLHPPFHEKQSR